ncbi:hypothetical protein BIV57_16665 [Mangrovactinospora gilvigrisea]|uniref:Lipoprotein n=1 Tax=Mangrovactinospora gilvigrisea TaxID=1428644 RepID=A0A1J7BCI2_9ACTN|nr:hypothetical protein [Mangrovactinospora gilvigrisea]OIV36358.1 hypothetical protein BIV57_16665 [Mangrovactinospora gilvigrisea]
MTLLRRLPPAALPLVAVLVAAVLVAVAGCGAPDAPRLSPDDAVRAATRVLTEDCLARRGLPSHPSGARAEQRVSDALFGAGRPQLALTLPTGYTVRAHTDGCLAAANRRLYGDDRRWFRASVVVDNLRPEAEKSGRSLARVRALHRPEIAAYRRMRAHARVQALSVLEGVRTPSTNGKDTPH